jgi:FtsP/CotA-like multicopper oxidase with cupredoxin domain
MRRSDITTLWQRGKVVNRRSLLKLGGMALAQAGASHSMFGKQAAATLSPTGQVPENKADYTLRIAPVTVELDRSHIVSTIGYNGTAPGPVLRMREGKGITVDVINDTDTPE